MPSITPSQKLQLLLNSIGLGFFTRTRGRLMVALLAMAALPVLLIGALSYQLAQQTLHERVYSQLNSVLDLKRTEVSNWISLLVSDALLLTDNYVNQEHITIILDEEVGTEVRQTYQHYMVEYLLSLQQARHGYEEIFLVLPDGNVLLSTDPNQIGDNVSELEIVRRTFSSPDEVNIQDMEPGEGDTHVSIGHVLNGVALAPMTTTDEVIAAAIIRVRLEESLYPILMDWPARHATGEIQLFKVQGDQWVYASPLRFSPIEPLALSLPVGLQARLDTEREGAQTMEIWQEPDYRGVSVLTGTRLIPEMGWVIAVQQDVSEALAPITDLRDVWTLVTVLVLLVAVGVGSVLARNLTEPLQKLTDAARDVGKGNLRTSVLWERPDEFGELAAAFNNMTASVRENTERSEQHLRELQALVKLSDEFLSSMDMRLTLKSAVREGIAATNAEVGSAFLMLEGAKEFQTMVSIGIPDSSLNLTYPVDAHSAPGYAMMHRKLVVTPDLSKETRYSAPPSIRQLGIMANVTAPMLIDGRVIGAITFACFSPYKFTDVETGMIQAIANHTAIALERTKLVNDLAAMYDRTLGSLVSALDTRDRETEGHSQRVVTYTIALADKLNVPTDLRQDIARGALLHDIGKIGVPDAILHKTGDLTPEEWAIVRKHPEWGKQILDGIPFLERPAQMVLTHHERWDGSGYPAGLKGEEIPLGARIFAVVDAFDAMTSFRPYRSPETYQKARAEIRAARGTQFDPAIVDAFLEFSQEDWIRLREQGGALNPEMGSLKRFGSGQLQAMNLIVSALTSSLDISEVLKRMADTIVKVTPASALGVYLYEDGADLFSYAAGTNLPKALRRRSKQGIKWLDIDGLRSGRTQFIKDLAKENSPLADVVQKAEASWKSALLVPLGDGEQLAGALLLFSEEGHVFEDDERLLFEQAGKQLSQVLANARLHQKVRAQAITDGLTGAYNRRYLDDFLSIEVKRCQRYQRPMAIVLLDMDHFGNYNEAGGHQAGDKALRDVVQLLNLGVRSVDLVARYGGEEFMVVLPETEAVGALDVADRMRSLIEKHNFPFGPVTASLGVAASSFVNGDSPDTEELIARADKALYRAKNDGRNRVQLWDPTMTMGRPSDVN